MGQADEISSQLFGPPEQSDCILAAISTTSPERRFFMDADAAQEDWPAVQENLCPPGLDAAETNLILDPIGFRFDHHIVEFRIVWRPQCQIRVEANLGVPIRVRRKGLADPGFRNSHCYPLIELLSVQSEPAVDLVSRTLPELDKVVLHETSRRLHQLYLAS